uniref:Uncharacterized protein n=1 Tax=Helianthus annuus TaxID=4232 RepID=A0A251U1I7_HELAN
MRSGAPYGAIFSHNAPNTITGGVMRQKKLGSAISIAALWREGLKLGPIKKRTRL